jgi:hypothetical protein
MEERNKGKPIFVGPGVFAQLLKLQQELGIDIDLENLIKKEAG